MDITIVMYHYVRPLEDSAYPGIKGLDLALFREQLAYIQRHYHVISAAELMDAVTEGIQLPPRALLLTFDDGYRDHYEHVFPILHDAGLPGCFFPPAASIVENHILAANKIHFVLASEPDKSRIIRHIEQELDRNRTTFGLKDPRYYADQYARANRFDAADVIYIKRMLQHALPEPLREAITDELFRHYVSTDETAFARELYMSTDELAEMQANGMYVGSHGYRHYWLNTIGPDEQRREIEQSLAFLDRVGSDTRRWIMCYPYGSYDSALLERLRDLHCTVGLTTEVGVADLSRHDPLALPRLDTNDLPKQDKAEPPSDSPWAEPVATGLGRRVS